MPEYWSGQLYGILTWGILFKKKKKKLDRIEKVVSYIINEFVFTTHC